MGGMPALLATSRDFARKALMTSGPAPMFSQFDTVNGRSSNPASCNCSSCAFWYDAIFRLVPAGTLVASGASEAGSPAAALPSAQPLSPAAAAVTPSSEVRNRRRSTPETGGEDMGGLPGYEGGTAHAIPGREKSGREFTGMSQRKEKALREGAPGARQRVSNRGCD